MTKKKISGGGVHPLPRELQKSLAVNPSALNAWEDITPLARNEWICWIESVKKEETRVDHLKRAIADLAKGKRRPCCWVGCVHRTDKPISRTQKWVIERQSKKRG